MGDLFDEIKTAGGVVHRRNSVDEVLSQLPDDERRDLLNALNDHSIQATVISRVVAKRGLRLPAQSINRFRRGEMKLADDSR